MPVMDETRPAKRKRPTRPRITSVSEIMSVRMPHDIAAWLRAEAERDGISITAALLSALTNEMTRPRMAMSAPLQRPAAPIGASDVEPRFKATEGGKRGTPE